MDETSLIKRSFPLGEDRLSVRRNGLLMHNSYFLVSNKGLASAVHRIEMCKQAAKSTDWIEVSEREAARPTWTRTVDMLEELETAAKTNIGESESNIGDDSDEGKIRCYTKREMRKF